MPFTVSEPGESYEAYVAARWPALCRTAHLLTGDPAAAEDLVQNTLIKVYARWRKVRALSSPEAYVRKILLNEFLTEKRRDRRRSARLHLATGVEEAEASDHAGRLDLWTELMRLPARQRAVVVLRYYEDLSEAETAATLGISVGTVKSQTHVALKTLRSRYAPNASTHEVTR